MDGAFIEVPLEELLPFLSGERQTHEWFVGLSRDRKTHVLLPKHIDIVATNGSLMMDSDPENIEDQLTFTITVPRYGDKLIAQLKNPYSRQCSLSGKVSMTVFQHDIRMCDIAVDLETLTNPIMLQLPQQVDGEALTVGLRSRITATSFQVEYSSTSLVESIASPYHQVSCPDDITPVELEWITTLPDHSAIIYRVTDHGIEMIPHMGGGVVFGARPMLIVAETGDLDSVIAMSAMSPDQRMDYVPEGDFGLFATPSHKHIYAMKSVSVPMFALAKKGEIELHHLDDKLLVKNSTTMLDDLVLEVHSGKKITHRYEFPSADGTTFYMEASHKMSQLKCNVPNVGWKKSVPATKQSGNNIVAFPFINVTCDGPPTPEPSTIIDLVEFSNLQHSRKYDVLIFVGDSVVVKSNINATGDIFLMTNDGNIPLKLWKGGETSFSGANIFDVTTNLPYHSVLIYNEKL